MPRCAGARLPLPDVLAPRPGPPSLLATDAADGDEAAAISARAGYLERLTKDSKSSNLDWYEAGGSLPYSLSPAAERCIAMDPSWQNPTNKDNMRWAPVVPSGKKRVRCIDPHLVLVLVPHDRRRRCPFYDFKACRRSEYPQAGALPTSRWSA